MNYEVINSEYKSSQGRIEDLQRRRDELTQTVTEADYERATIDALIAAEGAKLKGLGQHLPQEAPMPMTGMGGADVQAALRR